MSGRFDLAQKGFDVLFHAFRRLPPATAYLLFSPSNPDSGNRAAFRFFLDCATERDGEITILPYRIPSALYQDVLRGASYLLMPSLYEPFGAATEGALNGTPVVARGTGGLWRQVRSWTPCTIPAFYGGVIGGAAESCSAPTGILHREEFPDEEAGRQWPRILALEPRERMTVPLYRSMVETAHKALLDAVDLYRRPSEYAAIIRNGLEAVADGQTGWAVTVEKYRGIYDVAGRA
jgi:glycosyltransferase involved in cell wall biosynthesis